MISSLNMFYRIPSDIPLYDILNVFQKGSSHMAAVVKVKERTKNSALASNGEKYGKVFYLWDIFTCHSLAHRTMTMIWEVINVDIIF